MDSSFLVGIHVSLGLFACILFLKLLVQFGLPNHPSRFVAYTVGLCVSTYFVGLSAMDLGFLAPWTWMHWRSLPLIAGSLCLLVQTMMLVGNFSVFQQKIFSRIPLMVALLGFAFFPSYADQTCCLFLGIGGILLLSSKKHARYQKRLFLKMVFMFCLYLGLTFINWYSVFVIGQLFLFFTVFYLFLFEHTFGLAALVDDFKESLEGELQ